MTCSVSLAGGRPRKDGGCPFGALSRPALQWLVRRRIKPGSLSPRQWLVLTCLEPEEWARYWKPGGPELGARWSGPWPARPALSEQAICPMPGRKGMGR